MYVLNHLRINLQIIISGFYNIIYSFYSYCFKQYRNVSRFEFRISLPAVMLLLQAAQKDLVKAYKVAVALGLVAIMFVALVPLMGDHGLPKLEMMYI